MKKLSQSLMAQTIIAKRKEKKMTQQQLSDATGINRAVISRMESLDFISYSSLYSTTLCK